MFKNKYELEELIFVAVLVGSLGLQINIEDGLLAAVGILIIFIILGAPIILFIFFRKEDITEFIHVGKKHFTRKSKVLDRSSEKNEKNIERKNYATGILKINGEEKEYFAISGNDTKYSDCGESEGVIVCKKGKEAIREKIPMKRLMPDLSWREYETNGFADKYLTCTERKILAEILEDYDKEKLKEASIVIYTELEPCIYCYALIKQWREEGIDIQVYFDEMANEIINSKKDKNENNYMVIEELKYIKSNMRYRKKVLK